MLMYNVCGCDSSPVTTERDITRRLADEVNCPARGLRNGDSVTAGSPQLFTHTALPLGAKINNMYIKVKSLNKEQGGKVMQK